MRIEENDKKGLEQAEASKKHIDNGERQDVDEVSKIVQGWRDRIEEINKELEGAEIDTKKQRELTNEKETLKTMINQILDIRFLIIVQNTKFKNVKEQVENYEKQGIKIDNETEVIMRETEELNKELTSMLWQKIKSKRPNQDLTSLGVELLHIKVNKMAEQFKENIRRLNKRLEKIKFNIEIDEKQKITPAEVLDNIKKEGVFENQGRKDTTQERGIIGKIKRLFLKNKETDPKEAKKERWATLLREAIEEVKKNPTKGRQKISKILAEIENIFSNKKDVDEIKKRAINEAIK